METWNERLAKALAESPYNANQLAKALGIKAPTVSAWLGAGSISPAKDIKGDNLIRVCQLLSIRPEWLVFREGSMRPAVTDSELLEAVTLLESLSISARRAAIAQIKALADLDSEKLNSARAENSVNRDTVSTSTYSRNVSEQRQILKGAIPGGVSRADKRHKSGGG